jgi:short subunit dehydrogenase-like uncharacterized protein
MPSNSLQRVPVVLCDSDDVEALTAMAKRTKVVITTVGPYTKVRKHYEFSCFALKWE